MSVVFEFYGYYETAEAAFAKRDYVNAARNYRLAYLTYEEGEFPNFSQDLKTKGLASKSRYDHILNNLLSQEERLNLRREDDAFGGLEELFGY